MSSAYYMNVAKSCGSEPIADSCGTLKSPQACDGPILSC